MGKAATSESGRPTGFGVVFDTWIGRITAVVALITAIWGLPKIIGAEPGETETLPKVVGAESDAGETGPKDSLFPCEDADLSVTPGTGPSGTIVVLVGSGFSPDSEVDLRYSTATLPSAVADSSGAFTIEVEIPGNLDTFAPRDVRIVASSSPLKVGCAEEVQFGLEVE